MELHGQQKTVPPGGCVAGGAAAAVTVVAALAVYVRTLAPTVSGEDGGELAAAAWTLGIPHPTGYPLWCLVTHPYTRLIPWGDVGWRANLASAVFGALTAGLAAWLLARLTRNVVAAVSAGLALAFSYEFWMQSVIAEVYALNVFCIMLVIVLLVEWRQKGAWDPPWLAALAFGFALTNHSITVLTAPVFLAFAVVAQPRVARPRNLFALGLLLLPGLAVYLYLPIRAAADPPMNWGDPETLAGFWDVVTRAQHRFIMTRAPRTLARFIGQSAVFLRVFARQFTPWVLGLAVPGAVVLWRRDRAVTVMLFALFLVMAVAAIVVPNFELTRKEIWINTTYWIPCYAVVAVFIGAGIHGIAAAARGRARSVAVMLGLAAVASPLLVHIRYTDMSDYWFARDYGENVARTMEEDAIYFGSGDHTLFPLAYLQIVEGVRPDVFMANPYGYPLPEGYAGMPQNLTRDFGRVPTRDEEAVIFAWLLENTTRPMYSTVARPPGPRRRVNAGLLYKYVPPGVPLPDRRYWEEYRWNTLDPLDARGEWTAELVLHEYYLARGRDLLDRGELEAGLTRVALAARLIHDNAESLNNIGAILARRGLYEPAAMYLENAVRYDPGLAVAWRNLARARLGLGDGEGARQAVIRALALAPEDEGARDLGERLDVQ